MNLMDRFADAMAGWLSWLAGEAIWHALAIIVFYAALYFIDCRLRPRCSGYPRGAAFQEQETRQPRLPRQDSVPEYTENESRKKAA